MKKLFLFATLICLSVIAKAADVVIDGIFYNLSQQDRVAEVTYRDDKYNSYSGDVVIPASITFGGTNYSVTKIGGWTFLSCKSLTSVVIPESVTYIGGGAFRGCENLSSIIIPNSVTVIDGRAFQDCSSLTSLIIPNSVTYIGEYAFMNCDGLTSITIGNGVTEICSDAFRNCGGLTSITIPNSVNIIRERAFLWCINLKTVTIGSGVKYLADAVFSNCSKIEEIYSFAKNVPVPPYGSNTNMFHNVPIGNATLYVPASSIEQYKSLIPWYGFGTIAPLDYIDGIYYNFNEDKAEVTFYDGNYNSYSGEVTIPASVTAVWGKTYPVTSVGDYAFKSSTNLTSITIPNSVSTIGMAAFDGCSGLSSISLPDNVSNIGNVAFRSCSNLTSFTIPQNTTTIGSGAFAYCAKLANVYCHAAEVPNTARNAFDGSSVTSATLHILNRSIHLYKASAPWDKFGSYAGLYGSAHTLSYIIDGTEYKSYHVWEDEKVTPEEEPTKEGHTFSGWSEIPEWMPTHDVTVTGSYSVNSYTLTYSVDGVEYKRYNVLYGTSIAAEEEPTKEGYTFSGWSEIPETMPAYDVTVNGSFTINSYSLTYLVDGEVYKSYEINYGSNITAEVEPTKVGYTFSGWSEIPDTMPAHDVTVTGAFTINSYTLTYMVDGEVYKTLEVEYGTDIIPEATPQKTGYSFSGWSDIPSTMPAKDITISGTFTINSYMLTYLVGGEEYKTFEIEYETAITPEEEPIKEGYTFSGWSEIPETMPANDVTVTGSFIVNKYQVTYIIDGEVLATEYVEYGTAIVPPNVEEKEGFTFSGWADIPETMPAHNITIYGSFTSGIAEIMVANQCNMRIYLPNGKQIGKLQKGINIVILDDCTVRKVMIK